MNNMKTDPNDFLFRFTSGIFDLMGVEITDEDWKNMQILKQMRSSLSEEDKKKLDDIVTQTLKDGITRIVNNF